MKKICVKSQIANLTIIEFDKNDETIFC
jgi:hypothetical protein